MRKEEYRMRKIIFKVVTTKDEEYKRSLILRNKVLREPLGMDIEQDDLSKEQDAFHVLAIYRNEVVGTLYLLPLNKQTVQMKQVAIDPYMQGNGVGSQLVQQAELFISKLNCKKITLHARKNAWNFYQRMGYTFASETFEEIGITHKIMEKYLTNEIR